MKLIVCLSNYAGMMFNNRRQSRDSGLIKRLIEIVGNKKVYAESYSKTLFQKFDVKNLVFFNKSIDWSTIKNSDYVFIEDPKLLKNAPIFEQVIVCWWNRDYPADSFFGLDMTHYESVKTEILTGNSHDEIEIEYYLKG